MTAVWNTRKGHTLSELKPCETFYPAVIRYGEATCCDHYCGLTGEALDKVFDFDRSDLHQQGVATPGVVLGYPTVYPAAQPLQKQGTGFLIRAPEKIIVPGSKLFGICTYANVLLPQDTFATCLSGNKVCG